MNAKRWSDGLRMTAVLCAGALLAVNAAPAVKNMAVVAAAGSKLQDVPLVELAELCKSTQKGWADGRSFSLGVKDPETPDMDVAVEKLFWGPSSDVERANARLN